MAIYGYARVSTDEQGLEVQMEALQAAGCATIRSEKISGTSRQGRKELEILLDFLRPGDQLIVTRIDRLARSLRDLQNIRPSAQEARRYPASHSVKHLDNLNSIDVYTLTPSSANKYKNFSNCLMLHISYNGISLECNHTGRYMGRNRTNYRR